MTFKEFKIWCNKRTADGCWGMTTAMFCIEIYNTIRKLPFYQREKVWKEKYEREMVEGIIEPTEKKMIEIYGKVL